MAEAWSNAAAAWLHVKANQEAAVNDCSSATTSSESKLSLHGEMSSGSLGVLSR